MGSPFKEIEYENDENWTNGSNYCWEDQYFSLNL